MYSFICMSLYIVHFYHFVHCVTSCDWHLDNKYFIVIIVIVIIRRASGQNCSSVPEKFHSTCEHTAAFILEGARCCKASVCISASTVVTWCTWLFLCAVFSSEWLRRCKFCEFWRNTTDVTGRHGAGPGNRHTACQLWWDCSVLHDLQVNHVATVTLCYMTFRWTM